MKITMMRGFIAVKPYEKVKKDSIFTQVENNFSTGVVEHSFEGSQFPVGTIVIHGTTLENVMVSGSMLKIMKEANVMAVLDETIE